VGCVALSPVALSPPRNFLEKAPMWLTLSVVVDSEEGERPCLAGMVGREESVEGRSGVSSELQPSFQNYLSSRLSHPSLEVRVLVRACCDLQ
jgi:hypothetical protein